MFSIAVETIFKITNTKLYLPIVTLSTKDIKIKIKNQNPTRFYLDASFQGVKRLLVFAFDNTNNGANKVERNGHRKYFLPGVSITNYNVLIDDRNFCNQPIND